ncbi:MAG: TM2 domain-containing protein [Parvicellaceae bacterium]
MKKIYLLTFIIGFLASCSTTTDVVSNKRIQKRKYNKGFNFKSHKKSNPIIALNINKKLNTINKELINNSKVGSNDYLMASEDLIIDQSFKSEFEKLKLLTPVSTKKINTINLNENNNVNIKALKEIKNNILNNKTLEEEKIELISSNKHNKKVKKAVKKIVKSGNNTPLTDDEKLIAIILLVFLGVVGAHRFYLGDIGMGVLYLLTGGLCGIGVLIDLIKLLTDKMEKK